MLSNKLTLAQVQWSNEAVPISEQFDDVYFSTDDGIAEVEHTFIDPNNLSVRFNNIARGEIFRIAETGFGSGLNFLLTTKLWLERADKSCQLHFISFEKFPMQLNDLRKTHQLFSDNSALAEITAALQNQYPLLLPGWHDLYLFDKTVRLTLWFGDVNKGLPELDQSEACLIDAWFLDGFAPAKNPEMWQPVLFQQMARLSHDNTSFATFTAAGDVRRSLQKVGFNVNKQPGFGKKREMCFGTLAHKRPFSLKAPWFNRPHPLQAKNNIAIVIGAGLAGASIAYQLAKSGWQVKVLEAESEVATQASGNLAGAVHPLITADWNLRSQWYLQGFEATLRAVKPWLESAENPEVIGDLSGLIQLLVTEVGHTRVMEAFARVGLPDDFAKLLTKQQATELIGTKVNHDALLFVEGGWLYPKAIIEKCLQHESIELFTNTKVVDINSIATGWQVDASMQSLEQQNSDKQFAADIVVVATGSLDQNLNEKLALPIRPVKGQVSHLSEKQQQVKLNKVVTHEGYSCCYSGGAVTGATFEAPDMSQTVSLESHQHNLKMTAAALPDWLKVDADELSGRVAFRPTTPDHLPIIGAVVDPLFMDQAYLSQSHTHAVYRYQPQQYQQGLYVSNGHGARGLMSVFLAAEILLAEIQGKVLPQPLSLYYASHPARFQIRHWRSGKR